MGVPRLLVAQSLLDIDPFPVFKRKRSHLPHEISDGRSTGRRLACKVLLKIWSCFPDFPQFRNEALVKRLVVLERRRAHHEAPGRSLNGLGAGPTMEHGLIVLS